MTFSLAVDMELEPSLFDLCKAGLLDTNLLFSGPLLRKSRIGDSAEPSGGSLPKHTHVPAQLRLPPSVSSTASSSSSSSVVQFIKSFNPVAAARVSFANFMYSVVPHTIRGSFNLRYPKTNLLWRTALFACAFNVKLPDSCPIIFDSGASVHVTPFIEDFAPGTYQPCDIPVKGLTGYEKFLGKGIIQLGGCTQKMSVFV